MSNDVDVLMVGGAWHGLKLCAPRESGALKDGYVRTKRQIEGNWYWIGERQATPATDVEVEAAIIDFQHTPAWDLNR